MRRMTRPALVTTATSGVAREEDAASVYGYTGHIRVMHTGHYEQTVREPVRGPPVR